VPQQLRYEGSQLDDVLERVRDEHGPGARIVSADLARTKGIGGFFARETYQVTVELDPPPTVLSAEPAPRPAPARPSRPAEPAPIAARSESEPPPPRFAESARPAPGTQPEFARMLADLVEDPGRDPEPPATPVASAPRQMSAAQREASLSDMTVDVTDDDTSRPRVVSVADAIDEAPVALCELVGQLGQLVAPAVPPPAHGVVAIVGARSDAVEVAVALAQSMGRAASDVLVAAPTDSGVTPRTVAAIVADSARRRSIRGLMGPMIVAVAIAPGAEGERWATDTVAALDPHQVRVAVGGWRPIDRTAQHLTALRSVVGVDALDLVELEGAAAPEQFLRLGVPVGTIDGAEATATAWASLLLDCGRAATIVEGEPVVMSAAMLRSAEDVRPRDHVDRSVRATQPVAPVAEAPAPPAESRGPVPAVFPRVAVPVRH
jgi:hypothetical protein